MYVSLSLLCLAVFLLLPPVLLGRRLVKQRPAWWLILLLSALLGWLLWFGAYAFYQQHVFDLLAQGAEMPEGWDSDGASGVFAALLGWLISLIYFTPWLAVYLLIRLVRRGGVKSSSPESGETSDQG